MRRAEIPSCYDWWGPGRGLPVVGDWVHAHNGSDARYWFFNIIVKVYEVKYGWRFDVRAQNGPNPWTFGLSRLGPTVMTPEGPRCVDCGQLFPKEQS